MLATLNNGVFHVLEMPHCSSQHASTINHNVLRESLSSDTDNVYDFDSDCV